VKRGLDSGTIGTIGAIGGVSHAVAESDGPVVLTP